MFRRLDLGFFSELGCLLAGVLLSLAGFPSALAADPPPSAHATPISAPSSREGPNRPPPDGGGLTSEERERVRQVLSEVWSEPAVVQAREAVHQATIQYRNAIRGAVEKKDPSLAPLMDKMHRSIEFSAGKHRFGPGNWSGRPPGPLPPNPREALERLLEHEPGFGPLDRASKKRLLDLAHEVAAAPGLQELLGIAIRTTEPPADALQARRAFRDQLTEAMIARDPWAEQVFRHPGPKGRGRNEGNPPGGGPPLPPPPPR